MKDYEMRQYTKDGGGIQFDTLSNKHPVCRRYEDSDPRNDNDYDTFAYGTEPLPGDRTWARHARMKAGMKPHPGSWKGAAKP